MEPICQWVIFSKILSDRICNSQTGNKSVARRTEEQESVLRDPMVRVDLSFSKFVQLLFDEFRPSDLKIKAPLASSKSGEFRSCTAQNASACHTKHHPSTGASGPKMANEVRPKSRNSNSMPSHASYSRLPAVLCPWSMELSPWIL
jgi:hypothetical protein